MSARRRLAAGVLTLVSLVSLAGCGPSSAPVASAAGGPTVDRALRDRLPAALRRRGVLVVGTDPSYAPMSSYAADGRTIVGMEPDLARALGAVLGLRVRMRDVGFDTILDHVGSSRFDIALSAMTDTPERARKVDFVDYFRAGTAILVQRGNPRHISSLRALCGKSVSVESGTVQVDLIAHQQSLCGSAPVKVQAFASSSDALLRLRTGRAAAALIDLPPAVLLTRSARTKQYYSLATPTQYDPGYYGLVVSQQDPQLRAALADAVEELIRDGDYGRILRKWGLTNGAVDQARVTLS